MPLLNQPIGEQSFEIIRDRIGLILADEIDNQATLTYDPDLDLTVWVERTVSFDKSELPAVNISLARGTYEGQTAIQTDGTYLYNIDVFVNSVSKNNISGDVDSKFKLHKILGVCRAILENVQYKTLGFPPAFVMNRHIVDLNIADTSAQDGNYTSMGRLVLSVRVPENSQIPSAELIAGISTSIKLSQSNQGYYYQFGTSPTPPLLPTVLIFASKTTVVTGEEIELGWIATGVENVSITTLGQKPAIGYQEIEIVNTVTFEITATNATGTATDSITITVGAACLDATAVLKDTANNTISTTNIASGDSEDIIAPDGSINLVNTDNEPIQTETVRSGQTKSATIPNVSWTNTDGSPESTPYGDPIVCDAAPILNVDFSVNDTTPDTNQTVTFTDLTVGATQWLWDFGDGTTSSLQNPTKTYKLAGSYTVTLCATNGSISGKEIKTNYIVCSLQPLITTNLQANYDANDYNEATGTQLDSTANAFNLTQGTLIFRPTKTVGGLNGRDYLTYDGINDVLVNASLSFTRSSPQTIISVIRKKRIGTTNAEWLHRSNSTPISGTTPSFISGNSATVTNTMILFAGTATAPNSPLLNEWQIVVEQYNGASSFIRINNLPNVLVGNAGTTAATGLQESTTTSQVSNYDRAQRLIYNSALSTSDINSIVQHLQAKYNLYD